MAAVLKYVTQLIACLLVCLMMWQVYQRDFQGQFKPNVPPYRKHQVKEEEVPSKSRQQNDHEDIKPIKRKIMQNHTARTLTHSEIKRIEDEQVRRKSLLAKVCDEAKRNRTVFRSTGKFISVRENRFLYCNTPKVGSTSWMRVICVLTGRVKSVEELLKHKVHIDVHKVPALKRDEKYHYPSYFSFMFVRHPFARLLSAYRSKFENVAASNLYLKKKRIEIIKRYRKNPTNHSLEAGDDVTWEEFVQSVIDDNQKSFNPHYIAQHLYCGPCLFPFDFIGKLEDVAKESKYVLNRVNAPDDIVYPLQPKKTNSSNLENLHSYFSRLTKDQMENLYNIYELDFKLFGYKYPY
ncbi:carbohydrate sulfotransferase 14-like [Ptychodera flava]|uniref:carbohydrate sulfotransferase 14-like n=1 Tax=Ptychodera flava TaxID=63121 RepID=UPI003969E2C8